jgi:aspartate racemase
MEKTFYQEALAARGIRVLVPEAQDRAYVNRVIYEELVAGQVLDASRAGFVEVIDHLVARGAEGVILGCTEIPLLVSAGDVAVPLFDSTVIHAQSALNAALQ